jgi:hypothetical protein
MIFYNMDGNAGRHPAKQTNQPDNQPEDRLPGETGFPLPEKTCLRYIEYM